MTNAELILEAKKPGNARMYPIHIIAWERRL